MNKQTDHPAVVINPFLVYAAYIVLAAVLQRLTPLPFLATTPARVLGVLLFLLNFPLGGRAFRGMLMAKTSPNPNRPTSSLLTSGSYRFTRNPMYIGLTLGSLAFLVYFQIAWGLILLPALIWLITRWVIVPEEQYLTHKFGDVYTQYQQTVRRWL